MAENNPVATPPKKGKLKVIILLVVVLLLAVGLSVAGTLWFLGPDQTGEDAAGSAEDAFAAARYTVMEKPLVTSIQHPGRQRYVQVFLAFEADQPEPLAAAQKHMPLLRNVLISELGQSAFMQLQTPEGRTQLPERLLKAVNATLEQEGEPAIRRVLLRNFVVQ